MLPQPGTRAGKRSGPPGMPRRAAPTFNYLPVTRHWTDQGVSRTRVCRSGLLFLALAAQLARPHERFQRLDDAPGSQQSQPHPGPCFRFTLGVSDLLEQFLGAGDSLEGFFRPIRLAERCGKTTPGLRFTLDVPGLLEQFLGAGESLGSVLTPTRTNQRCAEASTRFRFTTGVRGLAEQRAGASERVDGFRKLT